MSSVGPTCGPKQSNGYFVPLSGCVNKVLSYSGGAGAGGSFLPGAFAVADWCNSGNAACSPFVSSISTIGAGGLLKDMGKTVVSSSRTFRKVQLIAPGLNTAGTSGVSTTSGPYLTGYLELSTGQSGVAAGLAGGALGNAANTAAHVAQVAYMPGLF